MTGNDFLYSIELIDGAYIEEAETAFKKASRLTKWISLAASLCIVTAGALAISSVWDRAEPNIPGPEHIPNDRVSCENIDDDVGGLGFEGRLCYDISELEDSNPWCEETRVSTLPIYLNNAYDETRAGIPKGMTEEQMSKRLERIVSAALLTVIKSEIVYDSSAKKLEHTSATKMIAECDKATVEIFADGRVDYMPHDGGKFTTLEDYIGIYGELLGYEAPIAVTGGNYDFYGNFHPTYTIYDAGNGNTEAILGYNLRYAQFYPNENGELYLIRLSDKLCVAEKTGDVRVITVDEAKQRLKSGDYKTSASYAFAGEEFIGKVELVYRNGPFEKMLLPYYRFDVQIPQDNDNAAKLGLKCYAAYYVSAIAGEQLDGLPLYNGAFN